LERGNLVRVSVGGWAAWAVGQLSRKERNNESESAEAGKLKFQMSSGKNLFGFTHWGNVADARADAAQKSPPPRNFNGKKDGRWGVHCHQRLVNEIWHTPSNSGDDRESSGREGSAISNPFASGGTSPAIWSEGISPIRLCSQIAFPGLLDSEVGQCPSRKE